MRYTFLLAFFITSISFTFAQISGLSNGVSNNGIVQIDSLSQDEIDVKLSGKTKYTDYKIFSYKNDTTVVDTTLTIQKHSKFNFRRKDNFELLEFHNQGQTFNSLAYDFSNLTVFPDIGFKAKQFLYMNTEDIEYYEVPTPTTEIMARTGLEQGQVLDALFTLNFSKRLNISIAYKGLRSLGKYRESLSSTGNFRTTVNYRTLNDRYQLRSHVTSQDFWNQESGGITDDMIVAFEEDNDEFSSRDVMTVNLDNTESFFKGTRVYLDHNYKLFSKKDTINQKDFSNLKIGHVFYTEKKRYKFTQSSAYTDFFGDSYLSAINEGPTSKLSNNQAYLEFNSKYILGTFKVKANYSTVEYGYDNIINPNYASGKTKLTGKAGTLGAEWQGKIGNFHVNADANIATGNGYLAGNYFNGEAFYKKDSVFKLKGRLLISSKSPNFNYLLHQSSYNNYNWDNSFNNVKTQNLGFDFDSKWGNISGDFTNILDYTYFDTDGLPQQYNDPLLYLKVKANKEFKVGKFALDNTLMYQNVSSGSEVFRVPTFTTRNTLYYSDYWFKGKPLYIQIGGTFKYFTKYNMNAYNPLLAEFTLQDNTEIGYPMLDAFVNMQIRRTRVFFTFDNVAASLLEKKYYSAPSYPYRDFVLRFGVVWNWFI